jgi:hypothetical protein
MTLEIQILVWDRHKNVVELNQLMGFQPSPLENWIILKLFKFQALF